MPKYLPPLLFCLFAMAFASQAQRPWQLMVTNDTVNYLDQDSVIHTVSFKTDSTNFPFRYNGLPVLHLDGITAGSIWSVQDKGLFNQYEQINDSIERISLKDSTWLFDLNAGLGDTILRSGNEFGILIDLGADTIYGIFDSIKQVITNELDTLVLSKSFGIVEWGGIYQIGVEGQGLGFSRLPPLLYPRLNQGDTIYSEGSRFSVTDLWEIKALCWVDSIQIQNGDTIAFFTGKAKYEHRYRQDYLINYNIQYTFSKRSFPSPLFGGVEQLCANYAPTYTGDFTQKGDWVMPVQLILKGDQVCEVADLTTYETNIKDSCLPALHNFQIGDTIGTIPQGLSGRQSYSIDFFSLKGQLKDFEGGRDWEIKAYHSQTHPNQSYGILPSDTVFIVSNRELKDQTFSLHPNPTSSILHLYYP